MKNHHRLLGSVSLAVTAIAASPALAQDQAATAQATETAAPSDGIGEIIVTAQKRGENLQRTAAAVTAISSDEIVQRGVSDLRAAQMVIPAARFQNENNNTQVFVRGVGSALDFPNTEPSVALNFDGIYMPREATSAAFFDIASVEVLPGPQGTLYGRGATGGTVNVQFQRPGFENEGRAMLEVGNYGLVHTTVAQDLALSDTVAVRAALDYKHHNGYFTSGADAANDIAGRLSLRYKSDSPFSAYVWAFGAQKNGKAPNGVNSPFIGDPYDDVGASQFTNQLYNQLTGAGVALPFTVGNVKAEDQDYHVVALGAEFSLDVSDAATLTYLPGYINLDSKPFYWLGSFLFRLPAKYEIYSNELRLSGKTGGIQYLAGLFQYNQQNSGSITNYYAGTNSFLVQQGFQIDRSVLKGLGVFGQATVEVVDGLRLTAGGRYSEDKREANGINPRYLFGGVGAAVPWSFEAKYTNFDWKAGIEYDLAPRVMVYAVAQSGYSPGTYNPISQGGIAAGDPFVNVGQPYDGATSARKSRLMALAAGFKSRFFDDKFQLNVEGFHYNYKDLILQQFDVSQLYNPLFNAKKVEIYGFQADVVIRPTRNDRFNGSVGYTHARNKDFVTPSGVDYTGLSSPFAPDWTLLGSYTHTFELGTGNLDAMVAARYESEWWGSFTHSPGTLQSAGAKVDAALTYDSGKNWTLGVWGKNLTDRAVLAATASAGFPGPGTGYLEAPRTYGMRFTVKY